MPKRTPSRYPHLATQSIDENGPGSILRDFEALLGFIEDGVRSTGKYHLLPMSRLFELDSMMTEPLRPRLKRPQQKSFPHLNGLYLLLRATQLGIPEGTGKASGRLVLDAALHQQWLQLNATERYFNLLEAWMLRASWEAVGSRDAGWMSHMAAVARQLWMSIPADGRGFSKREHHGRDFLYCTERATTLALLELFGLMTVERGEPDVGQSWRVTQVRHTQFGDELLRFVFDERQHDLLKDKISEVEFGVWQARLGTYFPEWSNSLKLPQQEFRDGAYYFKVSLGTPWRRIAIPAGSCLDELAECIIGAFDFEGDHLYGFHYVSRDGRRIRIEHPYIEDTEMHTDEITIGELPLQERQSMEFQYDFGADWRFDVRLEKVEPKVAELSDATIVESQGEAPAEYEYDDEW